MHGAISVSQYPITYKWHRFVFLSYAQIRDNIMLVTGPDKGKVGRMIGQETMNLRGGNTAKKAVIKLDNAVGGIREIKVVPYEMIAKTFQQQTSSIDSSKRLTKL